MSAIRPTKQAGEPARVDNGSATGPALAESFLQLNTLRDAPLQDAPFPFVVLRDFLRPDCQEKISRDFPNLKSRGSFFLDQLKYGESFARLAAELCSEDVRTAIEQKIGIDLTGRHPMLTVRGMSSSRDGRIHCDTPSKLVTLLLYLNSRWDSARGRLRLLNDKRNLSDYVVEIPPLFGSGVLFKVTHNCWHGYEPFVGPRRALQLNYVADHAALRRHVWRHSFSAKIKSLGQLLTKGER